MAPSVLPIWWCLLCCLCALPAFATFITNQQEAFVQTHNRLRTTAVPTVANMRFMTWSSTLETAAKAAVDKCPKKHAEITASATEVANMYVGEPDPVAITNEWIRCKQARENIMAASSNEIGCSAKLDCAGQKVVICFYNKQTDKSELGWPCSRCPAVTDKCLAGLCAKTDQTDDVVKYQNLLDAKTTPIAVPAASGGDSCRLGNCQNGGTKQNCKCRCATNDHLGGQCEEKREHFLGSVRLKFESVEAKKNNIPVPVSQSLFNGELQDILQTDLVEEVNKFCRATAANFGKCCGSGKGTWQAGDVNDATKAFVKPQSVKFILSSVRNDCDGSLNVNVYLDVASGDTLCSGRGDGLAPVTVLQGALTETWKTAVSVKLNAKKAKLASITPGTASDDTTTCTPPVLPECDKTYGFIATPSPNPSGNPDPGNPNPGNPNTGNPNKNTTPGTNKPGNPGSPGTKPPSADKGNLASRTATASLALMLISCICTVALLCVQSMTF